MLFNQHSVSDPNPYNFNMDYFCNFLLPASLFILLLTCLFIVLLRREMVIIPASLCIVLVEEEMVIIPASLCIVLVEEGDGYHTC